MVKIFVLTPLRSDFDDVHKAIQVAAADAGHALGQPVDTVRMDTSASARSIAEDIRQHIREASIVIADVSGANANVMWELGYAQALEKPVILLTREPGDVPFDLRENRFIIYEEKGGSSLNFLRSRVVDAIFTILQDSQPGAAPAPEPEQEPRSVFVSYSHADSDYLKRILVHLRPLERDGIVDLWSDTKIRVGDRWREEIRNALERARTAILLISADFLASEFIVTDELPPLLAAAEERGTRIIPVIVKPSRFLRDPKLSRFQALNDPTLPVIRMDEVEREELYAKLAEIIELDLAG